MAQQLYITYDSVTLDFQADGYAVLDGFYPETPESESESVSERFSVMITASSVANVETRVRAIGLACEHAAAHKDDARAAYLYFGVNGTVTAWRSKLLGGMVLLDASLSPRIKTNKVKLTIVLERVPYWEGSETQVPLTNGNGTNDTSGLTVYNHDDAGAGHDNYVEVAAADVVGGLPGATRLELTNSYATARLYTVWIGQNWTDPANLTHMIEGEASSTGTEVTGANYSGGSSRHYELASGNEATMFTWALSAALLTACKGGFFKIIARFITNAPSTTKLRLQLMWNSTIIWQSGQIMPDSSRLWLIRDLFTLRMPPWLPGQTALDGITMVMTGQQSTGSPVNVDLDFLQITPLDGWRMLECLGYGVVQNSRIVDDGLTGAAYVDDGAGAAKAGILVGYGEAIKLYPGKKQRLYFLMHSWLSNVAEIERTISVKLYYRPRRRTL